MALTLWIDENRFEGAHTVKRNEPRVNAIEKHIKQDNYKSISWIQPHTMSNNHTVV